MKNVIQLVRYFFIHSNGRHHPLKYYYELLKSLVPQDQWHDYSSGLINDIKNRSRWIDYERISQLYIWESQWDKLFELLQQNASFERIADAEQYLADSYPNELGTRPMATELIRELKVLYPARRALLEELGKV